jgi:uncharacterized protein YqeY
MSTLNQRLNDEWKNAMRSGDSFRRDILSGLRAAVKKAEIDSRGSSAPFDAEDNEAVQGVIEREAKKRRDAIEEYNKAGRPDRAESEHNELLLLQEYLPQQLTDEEIEELVRATVAELGATDMKQMGAVMGALRPKTAGRADGKKVNEIVRRVLG